MVFEYQPLEHQLEPKDIFRKLALHLAINQHQWQRMRATVKNGCLDQSPLGAYWKWNQIIPIVVQYRTLIYHQDQMKLMESTANAYSLFLLLSHCYPLEASEDMT